MDYRNQLIEIYLLEEQARQRHEQEVQQVEEQGRQQIYLLEEQARQRHEVQTVTQWR